MKQSWYFFLEFPCFFNDPKDVSNSISGSSAFSQSSLYSLKFLVHVLVKVQLEGFWASPCEHMKWMWLWGSLIILWHCPPLGLEWKLTFSSPVVHAWVLQICWYIECSTLTVLFLRILNMSAGIPSPPLASFIIILPKAHLTSHSRMSGSRWLHSHGYLGH